MFLKLLLFHLFVVGKNCMESRYFQDGIESQSLGNSSALANNGGVTICRDGWLPFQGSCYLFGHNAVDFTEAQHFCWQHHKSQLIHVNNARENEFIKDRLREFQAKNWWIGITDEVVEGDWKWLDTDEDAVYSDWYPGQKVSDSEDCAIFWLPSNFKWADYSCLGHFYPVCEIRGNTCGTPMTILG